MTNGNDKISQQYVTLEPSQPFCLDHLETIWQVWEGTVDVYAATASDSQRFQQVFLFTASQGQTLFGLPQLEDSGGIHLIAMSTSGAELKIMTRSGLLASATRGGQQIFEVIWFMIEEWLDILLSSPDILATPRNFLLLESGERMTLSAGQKLRTGREVIWVRAIDGDVRYGRLPDHPLAPTMAIPLISQAWLTAATDAQVQGLTTEEVFAPPDALAVRPFWQPLDECQRLFIAIIEEYFATEIRRSSKRLADRQEQREKLLLGAATHLLRNDVTEITSLGTGSKKSPPVLIAIQAIARQLGVPEEQVRLPKENKYGQKNEMLMSQITRLAGLQARRIRLEDGWNKRDNGPMLGYYGPEGLPVALLPLSPDRYQIFHPGEISSTEVTDQDLTNLQPYAHIFYVGLVDKFVSLSSWLKFSLKKSWSEDYWTVILASLAAGMIPMLTPFITDTIFSDLIPINDRQGHVMVIQVMMVAAFSSVGVSLTRGVAIIRVKGRSRLAAEAALWLRMLSLPAAFFRKYESGDLAQRMNGITLITMMLSGSTVSAIFNGIFSFFSLLMMFYYSWKLGLAAAALLFIYVGIVFWLLWKMVHYKRGMMMATGRVAGKALQVLNGLSKFRMQGAEAQAFYLWAKEFGEEWKWNRATRWKANWLEVVTGLQPILLSMLMFWLTMYWLEAGDKERLLFITQSDFMSFNAALAGFSAAITGMVPVLTQLLDVIPLMERLKPILETEPEVSEDKVEAEELTGQIEVSNLSFRYSPEKPQVLQNISLKIRPGQFIALVGGSGSGKSTLLRLLLGFERPESGVVYFDGQDMSELSVTSVRSQMGVVLQSGQMMAGDIFTNIVGSLPLTIEDAWQAAEMVGLADDIRAMPMGMHTLISEGASNISGGQRQRILIARSIVNRPRIIIFDEATSALDNRTQAIVTQSLEKLKATRIIVAHRLSTIISAEHIYVMDKGQIVEDGTYENLIEQDGTFAALARRQMA